ncbi:MAG: outer membrane beta-barrel protein [Bacteroidota bacterium]
MFRGKALNLSRSLKVAILVIGSLLIFRESTMGQTIQSVSGRVINSSNEPTFGNVIVLSPKDSTIITGTSFIEGYFELSNLNTTSLFLKLTSLEFEDLFITIVFEGEPNIDLGDIMVSDAPIKLEEVVVAAQAPIVAQRPDGSIELKIANTALASSTSALEIIGKSPGVLVDENDEISIFGKGNAVIFINGIKADNQRLSTISPSTIASIEIITNPGPRYDAAGNAVINVITKRNLDEGTKGVVKNYYSYNDFAGYENRINTDLNYKKGKWSLNASYGLLIGNDRWSKTTTRTRNESDDFFSSDIALDWLYERNNFSNYSFGGQYDLTDDSYLSLEYNGAYEDMGGDQLSNNTIIDGGTGVYNSLLIMDDLNRKNIFNINYFDRMDSLGSNLFIGSQYASYRNDFDNDITESSTVDGIETIAMINNVGEGDIQIFSVQADYTKVYSDKISLEMGGKFSYVDNTSFTDFFDLQEGGALVRNIGLSNSFQYYERVPAAYVNFKKRINDNTNYSLGFRTELTDYTLATSVDEGSVIEDNYINIFPNASFDTRISNRTNVFFTYSSRILRPSYESLNPFVIYQDEFTSIRGNPDLQPSRIHSLEIGGAYDDWHLKMGYTYTIDRITRAAFQLEEGSREYVLQSTNFDKEHAFLISLSRNINLKWWQSTNNLSASYNNLIDGSGIFEIRDNEPSFYFYSQNSFKVDDWITIYLTGWYLSDLQDGVYLRENQSTVNIGLEKDFLNGVLRCNLDFNDIFHTIRADGNYRSGTTDIVYGNTFNTNYVRFSASYSFGKLKKSHYKNRKVGESERRRI